MNLNIIRAIIFLVAGLLMIIFRVQLNDWKNNLFEKFHIKRKNEARSYIYFGIVSIVISMVLFIIGINQ